MNRIVIVARTRMGADHICVGAHDLDRGFHGLRLFDRRGQQLTPGAPFTVGSIWSARYWESVCPPPHTEDVRVKEFRRLGQVDDLRAMVLQHDRPWTGPPRSLFDGTVHCTGGGALYVPVRSRLPSRSTGFWLPEADLVRSPAAEKARFACADGKSFARFTWVGDAKAPDRITAGSLVRVSLSRRFGKENVPEGYYVQISGVLGSGL